MSKLPSFKLSNATRVLVDSATACNTALYQEKLAQRILELKTEIRILEGCHNSVTPICRLPPEILSNIFVKLWGSFKKPTQWQFQTKWIRVSHVCAHWRSVALECVSLWTRLHFTVPAFVELTLRRAGKAPLDVCFPYEDPNEFKDILEQVLSRPDSLRSVELGFDRFQTFDGYNLAGDYRIPTLPSASVMAKWTHAPLLNELVLIGGTPSQDTFPETFLRPGPPSLQHLDLRYVGLRWNLVPLGRHLRTLRLSQKSGDGHHRPLVAEFVDSIKGMPHLEHLELEEYAPRQLLKSEPPVRTRLSFPALRRLEITDSAPYLSSFFRTIEIPNAATTMVKFASREWRYGEATNRATSQTLAIVKLAFRKDSKIHAGVPGLRLTKGTGVRPNRFHIHFEDGDLLGHCGLPALTILLRTVTVEQSLDLVDSQLHLSTVHCLHLSFRPSSEWAAMSWLERLLHVHTLILGYEDLQNFIKFYLNDPPSHGATIQPPRSSRSTGHAKGTIPPYPFPALSTLICRDVTSTSSRSQGGPDFIEPLVKFLQARSLGGHPLAELRIDSCVVEIRPSDIQLLGNLVPDLKLVVDNCFEPAPA